MGGRRRADAKGVIRRVGPCQAAGVCTGYRNGVPISRHVRWAGSRRVASLPAADIGPKATQRGVSVDTRAHQVECDREAYEIQKEIQGSQERQIWPSNSSGRPKTAR